MGINNNDLIETEENKNEDGEVVIPDIVGEEEKKEEEGIDDLKGANVPNAEDKKEEENKGEDNHFQEMEVAYMEDEEVDIK